MTASITETTDDYYHVRFNDPEMFDEIRTPDWAADAAGSVADGAEVRTGHQAGWGESDWVIQSVLVPTDAASDESTAVDKANQVVENIES